MRSSAIYTVIASPEFHSSLLFNTSKRAGWQVSLRMRHCHVASAHGVLELPVVTFRHDMGPSGSFDLPYDVSAVQVGKPNGFL